MIDRDFLLSTTIDAKAKRHFLIGLFLVCMCGLTLQIIGRNSSASET